MTGFETPGRRDVLKALGVTTTAALGGCSFRRGAVDWDDATTSVTTFEAEAWPADWQPAGVVNRSVTDDGGVLEAGTDLYPASQRAIAFRQDARATDERIRAHITQPGVGPGVALRRVGPRLAYLAILDLAHGAFRLVARNGVEEREIASRAIGPSIGDVILELAAIGTNPTTLHATVAGADGGTLATLSATDDAAPFQQPGDPGVVATGETGLTPEPNQTPGALEQWRLLGVGDFASSLRDSAVPIDESVRAANERASSTVFERIELTTRDERRPTPARTVAASGRYPTAEGVAVRVVTDLPADVAIEHAPTESFEQSTRVALGQTNDYRTVFGTVSLPTGNTRYWRPVLERAGETTRGPIRQARTLPARNDSGRISLAIGSCATRFADTFAQIAALDPDVFVWEGDLNYPDAMGPLAQTHSGYAGLWKALLQAPELASLFDSTCFATSRDDHDYGQNDSTQESLRPYGIEPYEHILEPDSYYHFGGGPLDAWVLDTRKWRDPHDLPDTPEKTLLGEEQLGWLREGLETSAAPFKIVCSPGPVFNVPNPSFSWAKGFTAERDQLLSFIDDAVSGAVVFVTGDTHSGCVTRKRGFLEIRAAPLDMPEPAWHATSSGESVEFAANGTFFAYLEADQSGDGEATLSCSLRYGTGDVAWETQLTAEQ